MESWNKLVLLVAVSLAVAVSIVNASSLLIGQREFQDFEICYERIDIPAQQNVIINTDRYCDAHGLYITKIYAHDRASWNKGGYASVSKGGLKQKNVTLHFWSQRSQSLNFTIHVYAKRPN